MWYLSQYAHWKDENKKAYYTLIRVSVMFGMGIGLWLSGILFILIN